MPLAPPPPDKVLARRVFKLASLSPQRLWRVSRHADGEPYFGRLAVNRFDDPRARKSQRFGTHYSGLSLRVAIAETVLHDEQPVDGRFLVPWETLQMRYVVRFDGEPLRLLDLTGESLKRSGIHPSLSTVDSYELTQRWALALYKHPQQPDGLKYLSYHLNTAVAVVLFDHAERKLRVTSFEALSSHSDARSAFRALGIDVVA